MAFMNFGSRSLQAALGIALAAQCGAAAAIDFQIGENTLKFENLFTIGASWRMQDRDPSLIGKASLWRLNNPTGPGLCYTREQDNGVDGPERDTSPTGEGGTIQLAPGVIPDGCSTSVTPSIQRWVAAPGSTNPSGDNANLAFDKYDVVHAVAKFTSDISFSYADYNIFVRPIVYFDANYTDDFTSNNSDTTLQDRRIALPDAAEERVGMDLELLDYNISHLFTVLDHDINVKVGNQVLNWGESSLLIFNSLNTINPLDATKLRFPGADLKEFFQPVGMVVAGTDLFENVSVEGWYQYDWKPLRIDPPGTFFSQSDTLGAGGTYAQNGQGREPDDPDALFRGIDTCGSGSSTSAQCFSAIGTLGSTSSRIVRRNFAEEEKRKTDDLGQYGLKLQLFLEDFNNGTELAFYYANYHSRLPIVSTIAATQRTCMMGNAATSFGPGGTCGTLTPGQDIDNPLTPQNEEPLPVDTVSLLIEYPENIQLYGLSFNTTVGDWAISGEAAYRPNLPTQIHTLDLSVAALGPSFPNDPVVVPSPTATGGSVVFDQRLSFPDFVSYYRGRGSNGYENGE